MNPNGAGDPAHPREQVRATLLGLSRSGSLPVLPHAAAAALALARNPEVDLRELCALIEGDVGLAARTLRLANSAVFGQRTRVTTLPGAVRVIGMRETCDLLIAAGAQQFYGSVGRHGERLWNHALAVAIGAQELAKLTRTADAELAFLPGLFHDVGRVVFLLADVLSYEVIRRLAERGEDAMPLERGWCGCDHAQAGGVLTDEWGLDPRQSEAVYWHHDPPQARTAQALATIIQAADDLAYSLGAGAYVRPVSGAPLFREVGLSAEDEALWRERVRGAFEGRRGLAATRPSLAAAR